MPDEIGTETFRSDDLSVAESIFGDTADDGADDAAAAAVEGEDADEETEQDRQGPDDGAGEEAASPEELKVVVSIKGSRATIGVQRTSSDPHIESFDDPDLSGLAQEVPAVVERAKARWEEEPRYPAHVRPAPPVRRRARREQGPEQASTAGEGADQQQPGTLRLF